MTINELFPDIYLEDINTEFKGIINEGNNQEIGWLKTIVAFANTDGGKLFIGVEDKTHKVVALDHQTVDKIVLMIHRLIKNRITPSINYDIEAVPVNITNPLRYILCITVNKSADLPVSLHQDGLLGIYVRNFGQSVLASSEQIKEMVLLSESVPFDRTYINTIYNPDDYKKLMHHCETINVDINDKLLISKGIISAKKEISNGMEMFKDDYSGTRTMLVASLWPGLNKGDDIVEATETYSGNILDVLDKALKFVSNHSNNGYVKQANTRIEYISYPSRSVMEGIVNAIGHRNYFIQGSQIEVNIFIDRMEITSPGSLLGVRQLKKEKDLSSIIPRRRNEIICSILELCKYMESKGSGFDKIEEDYSLYSDRYKPFVNSDGNSFTLVLPDITYKGVVDETVDASQIYSDIVTDGKNDLKILAFCYLEKKNIKQIADYLSITPSTYFRKNTIAKLTENGLLIESLDNGVKIYRTNHSLVHIK